MAAIIRDYNDLINSLIPPSKQAGGVSPYTVYPKRLGVDEVRLEIHKEGEKRVLPITLRTMTQVRNVTGPVFGFGAKESPTEPQIALPHLIPTYYGPEEISTELISSGGVAAEYIKETFERIKKNKLLDIQSVWQNVLSQGTGLFGPAIRLPKNAYERTQNDLLRSIAVEPRSGMPEASGLAGFQKAITQKSILSAIINATGAVSTAGQGATWENLFNEGMTLDRHGRLVPASGYPMNREGELYTYASGELNKTYFTGGTPARPYTWQNVEGGRRLMPVEPGYIAGANRPFYAYSNVLVPGETTPRTGFIRRVQYAPNPLIPGGGIGGEPINPGFKVDIVGNEKRIPIPLGVENLGTLAQKGQLNLAGITGEVIDTHTSRKMGTFGERPIVISSGENELIPTGANVRIPTHWNPATGKYSGETIGPGEKYVQTTENLAERITQATGLNVIRDPNARAAFLDINAVTSLPSKWRGLGIKEGEYGSGRYLTATVGGKKIPIDLITGEIKGGTAIDIGMFGSKSYKQMSGILADYAQVSGNETASELATWFKGSMSDIQQGGQTVARNWDWELLKTKYNELATASGRPEFAGAAPELAFDVFRKTILDTAPGSQRNISNIRRYGMGWGDPLVNAGPVSEGNIEFLKQVIGRAMTSQNPQVTETELEAEYRRVGVTSGFEEAAQLVDQSYSAGMSDADRLDLVMRTKGHTLIADTFMELQAEYPSKSRLGPEDQLRLTKNLPQFMAKGQLGADLIPKRTPADQAANIAARAYVAFQTDVSEGNLDIQPTDFVNVGEEKARELQALIESGTTAGGEGHEAMLSELSSRLGIEGGDNRLLRMEKTGTYMLNPQTINQLQYRGPFGNEEIGNISGVWLNDMRKLLGTQGTNLPLENAATLGTQASQRTFDLFSNLFAAKGEFSKKSWGKRISRKNTGFGGMAGRFGPNPLLEPGEFYAYPKAQRRMLRDMGYRGKELKRMQEDLMTRDLQGVVFRYPVGNEFTGTAVGTLISHQKMMRRMGPEEWRRTKRNPFYNQVMQASTQFAVQGVGDFDYDPMQAIWMLTGGNQDVLNELAMKGIAGKTVAGVYEQEKEMLFDPNLRNVATASMGETQRLLSDVTLPEEAIAKGGWRSLASIHEKSLKAIRSKENIGPAYNMRRILIPAMAAVGYGEKDITGATAALQAIYQVPLDDLSDNPNIIGSSYVSSVAQSRFEINKFTQDTELVIGSNIRKGAGTRVTRINLSNLKGQEIESLLRQNAEDLTRPMQIEGKDTYLFGPQAIAPLFSFPGGVEELQQKLEATTPDKYMNVLSQHITDLAIQSGIRSVDEAGNILPGPETVVGKKRIQAGLQRLTQLPDILARTGVATRKAIRPEKRAVTEAEKFREENALFAAQEYSEKLGLGPQLEAMAILSSLQRGGMPAASQIQSALNNLPGNSVLKRALRSQMIRQNIPMLDLQRVAQQAVNAGESAEVAATRTGIPADTLWEAMKNYAESPVDPRTGGQGGGPEDPRGKFTPEEINKWNTESSKKLNAPRKGMTVQERLDAQARLAAGTMGQDLSPNVKDPIYGTVDKSPLGEAALRGENRYEEATPEEMAAWKIAHGIDPTLAPQASPGGRGGMTGEPPKIPPWDPNEIFPGVPNPEEENKKNIPDAPKTPRQRAQAAAARVAAEKQRIDLNRAAGDATKQAASAAAVSVGAGVVGHRVIRDGMRRQVVDPLQEAANIVGNRPYEENRASRALRTLGMASANDAVRTAVGIISSINPEEAINTLSEIKDILTQEGFAPTDDDDITNQLGKAMASPDPEKRMGVLSRIGSKVRRLKAYSQASNAARIANFFINKSDFANNEEIRTLIEGVVPKQAEGTVGRTLEMAPSILKTLQTTKDINETIGLQMKYMLGSPLYADLVQKLGTGGVFQTLDPREQSEKLRAIVQQNPEMGKLMQWMVATKSTATAAGMRLPDAWHQITALAEGVTKFDKNILDVSETKVDKGFNAQEITKYQDLDTALKNHIKLLEDHKRGVVDNTAALADSREEFERLGKAAPGTVREAKSMLAQVQKDLPDAIRASIAEQRLNEYKAVQVKARTGEGLSTQEMELLAAGPGVPPEQDKTGAGGLGKFARRALGGFGLMYMRSIFGIMTEGIGLGGEQREALMEGMYGYANKVLGGAVPYSSRQDRINAELALSGAGYNVQSGLQLLGAKNPVLRSGFNTILAGVAGAGATEWMASMLGVAIPAPALVGIGAAVAGASVVAGAISAAGDPRGSGVAMARAYGDQRDPLKAIWRADASAWLGYTYNTTLANLTKVMPDIPGGQAAIENLRATQLSMTMYGRARDLMQTRKAPQRGTISALLQEAETPAEAAAYLSFGAEARYGMTPETAIYGATFYTQNPALQGYMTKASMEWFGAMGQAGTELTSGYAKVLAAAGLSMADIYGAKGGQGVGMAAQIQAVLSNITKTKSANQLALFNIGAERLGAMEAFRYTSLSRALERNVNPAVTALAVDKLTTQIGELGSYDAAYLAAAQQNYINNLSLGLPTGINPLDQPLPSGKTQFDVLSMQGAATTSTAMQQRRMNVRTTLGAIFQETGHPEYAEQLNKLLFARTARTTNAAVGGMVPLGLNQLQLMEGVGNLNPTMIALSAQQKGIDLSQFTLGTLGGTQFPGWVAGRTDMNLSGNITGLGWGRTGLGVPGGPSATQMATSMWGDKWRSNPILRNMVVGQRIPGLEGMPGFENGLIGGTMSYEWDMIQKNYDQQMAQLGIQMAQLQLGKAFQTGVGISKYSGAINPQTGRPFGFNTGTFGFNIPGAGSYTSQGGGMWGLEDASRNLGYAQQEWNFGFQQRQLNLGSKQFYENLALNRQMSMAQRGWTQEDWTTNNMMRELQWQWRVEDYGEESRFLTGRERKKSDRQMRRETIMHGLEEDQIDKQMSRQRQLWQLEDQRFDVQKRQYEENKAMQQEQLNMAQIFYEERKKLEEEQVLMTRAYYIEQQKLQEASIGLQAQFAADQKTLSESMATLNFQQEIYNGLMSTLALETLPHFIAALLGIEEITGRVSGYIVPPVQNGGIDEGEIEPPDEENINRPPRDVNTPDPEGSFKRRSAAVAAFTGRKTSFNSDIIIPIGRSSTPQTVNIYIGNEKLGSYVINEVTKDLNT